jgi:hypothetical protein
MNFGGDRPWKHSNATSSGSNRTARTARDLASANDWPESCFPAILSPAVRDQARKRPLDHIPPGRPLTPLRRNPRRTPVGPGKLPAGGADGRGSAHLASATHRWRAGKRARIAGKPPSRPRSRQVVVRASGAAVAFLAVGVWKPCRDARELPGHASDLPCNLWNHALRWGSFASQGKVDS